MGVSPALDHSTRWRKWRGYPFLLTWIILQAVSGLRHKTACYYFPLMVDSPCAATEMLLPTMLTLGVSSDVTCHSEISGASLRYKGVEEIRRCCQQRENDTVRDYCLPAMKNQLPGHYFPDFVSRCTAATRCQLPTSESRLLNTDGADYVTFTFECVHKDTVLHIQRDSTLTEQEVYLYNDQHDGEAHANCLAYSHECNSHVIIQLAAARVVSLACVVDFTDGDVSTTVDCKSPPASRNCSSAMFESKSNYVNMSIFMTVDPGRQEKEFLWIRAKADTGENVTVVCGANIPLHVSLTCTTSSSTTTSTTSTSSSTISMSASTTPSTTSTLTPTASTSASTTTSSTSTSAPSISTSASTTTTSASTTTTSTTSTTTTYAAATTATTSPQTSNNASSKHTPVAVTCVPIALGVSVAVLIVGFVSGWIMSRCFYQRQTRKNGTDVYNTTSTMEEEHTYTTVQPTSAATYANTSYEYYNQ